jgi:GNAT superfamily N-acetyltransferase
MNPQDFTIRRLLAPSPADIEGLADVLSDCVAGGASIGFMAPFERTRAVAFWQKISVAVTSGQRAMLIAEDSHGICGTAQLILDLPDNMPHRADVAKVLVHSRMRRRGVGEALMRAIESLALECNKTLLVLDTVTDSTASRLYQRLGWTLVGDIPKFALLPNGDFCSTTYFYRDLAGPVKS